MPNRKPFLLLAALLLTSRAAAAQTIQLAEPRAGTICQGYSFEITTSSLFGIHDYPLVTEVGAGSPAARAGLRVGDRLVSVNGRDQLRDDTPPRRPAPGDSLRLVVRRGQEELPLLMIVGELRPDAAGRLVCDPNPAKAAPTPSGAGR